MSRCPPNRVLTKSNFGWLYTLKCCIYFLFQIAGTTIHSQFIKPLFGGSPTSWFMNNFAFSEIMRALKESNVLYRIWNTTQCIRVKTPVYLHNIQKLFSFKRVLCSTTQKSRAHFQNNT